LHVIFLQLAALIAFYFVSAPKYLCFVVTYLHIMSQAETGGVNSLFTRNMEMRVTLCFMFYCRCLMWVITWLLSVIIPQKNY